MPTERDFTELSDDEIMNLGAADIERMTAAADKADEGEQGQEEETEEAKAARIAAEEEAAKGEQEEEQEKEENEEEQEEEEEELTDPNAELPDDQIQPPAAKEKPAKAKPDAEKTEPAADDVAKQAEEAAKLFAPFKANGRDMTIRNADEGRRLMQLGAGYNAKMAQLKPDLAIISTLRREGLLDADKLAFLIDLHKKNPEAIGKLVKDAGVDVLELDDTKVAGYKPTNYSTSEKEVEMDEVLDGLKESPKYRELMDTVANKWDKASKNEVGNNPGLLNLINTHMEAGFYDKIVDEVTRKQALGEIPSNTPFLAAYAKVGDELNAAGVFGTQEAPPARKLVTPGKEKARAQRDDAVDARRKAAAPARKAGNPAPQKEIVDAWNMSDDDFKKLNIR